MTAFEASFDGLVGPTHGFAGLSRGNLASEAHAGRVSSPRRAALQGLAKMKALADRGVRQAVLPPQERPAIWALRDLGYRGTDGEILRQAAAGPLLAEVSSASSMWAANAATVSPSADTFDGRVHLSVANLQHMLHRSFEAPQTERTLRAIFADERRFAVHPALPRHAALGDEGAANHTRLCRAHGAPGVELFVHGGGAATRLPARQTLAASEAVARRHGLRPERTVFARQSPAAIDAGAFHADVVLVGHLDVLFCHASALADQRAVIAELERALGGLRLVEVAEADVPLRDAVASYLLNGQLLDEPSGGLLLAVPEECLGTPTVRAWLERLTASGGPIDEVLVVDVGESMMNGGGPACLRLRVVLTGEEAAAVAPGVWLDGARHAELTAWVERHYRDRLAAEDLADPRLLVESRAALDELTGLLGLGSLYPFQRDGSAGLERPGAP